VPRSTDEAGIAARAILPREGGAGSRNRTKERQEGMQSPDTVSTKLERIATVAKQMRGKVLTSLSHHIDMEWMREAYRRTRKDAAVGVDGQTAAEYAAKLEENLQSLLNRAKAGDAYRAPPVRRVHIPKGDGRKTRPIGVPTFEDKVLQRAAAMALGAVYEQDFLECSYGFRPGRSLLANIYLHEVLDEWCATQVQPRLSGRAVLVRFADDFVIIFAQEEDARRVLEVLPKRFGKYGLKLHPEKTRLVPFRRPDPPGADRPGGQQPGTFDLLGFTHYWGRSLKGSWVIKRKTACTRLSRALRRIRQWCRANRHLPVKDQHEMLAKKVTGHYNYYGITGNGRALSCFVRFVQRAWHKWLGRRNNRGLPWARMMVLLAAFPLPQPHIVHSVVRRAASP
jgi:reverse transcriptase-like protein